MLLVEYPDGADDVDGVDAAGAGVGEDGDEDVLLHVERARVEGELPPAPPEEDAVGDGGGHEVAQRHHRDLGGDGGDGERLLPVPEELVQEGEQHAGGCSQDPHAEGEDGRRGVVIDRHRQGHLLDGRVLFLFLLLLSWWWWR